MQHNGIGELQVQIFESRSALRDYLSTRRDGRVALVPTMGFLHAGHMALVAAARARGDTVVASLFVNPAQFGEAADLAAYPRDETRDMAMFRQGGVDAVFMPPVDEMYAPDAETVVEVTELSKVLTGAVRPGHFRGVTTVVAKLFNIVQPDLAFFGEKDFQQLQVIRRMVKDLDFPVEIVGVPTVREADGLAMSSRNVRLGAEDRAAAVVLSRALFAAAERCRDGASAEELQEFITKTIAAEPRADIMGVDLCDAETLEPATGEITRPVVALLAVAFGDVLLIDQHVLNPDAGA